MPSDSATTASLRDKLTLHQRRLPAGWLCWTADSSLRCEHLLLEKAAGAAPVHQREVQDLGFTRADAQMCSRHTPLGHLSQEMKVAPLLTCECPWQATAHLLVVIPDTKLKKLDLYARQSVSKLPHTA